MKYLHRCLILFALPLFGAAAWANDYPTSERVLYVEECMRDHPGPPRFEMVNKCSCALDALAKEVKYEDYMSMTTIVKAMSIGGERGGTMRDNETIKPQIKRYRALQAKVQRACFISGAQ
jgi:hypothetical protein